MITVITNPAELPPTLLHFYYAESREQIEREGRCWQLGKWYYFEEENGS